MSTRYRVVVDCDDEQHAEEVAKHLIDVRPGDVRDERIHVYVDVVSVMDGESGVKRMSGVVTERAYVGEASRQYGAV